MDQIQAIALRICDLREVLGLTPEQVAQQAEMTTAEYLAYESGKKDFSFSHLFNIAQVLGVDISDLLTGESPRLKGYVLTRKGHGLTFQREEHYHYQHLAYNFHGKKSEPFLVTVYEDAPGMEKEPHAHEGQEFDCILEGQLRIILDGNEMVLSPGDSIYYDSHLPHAMYAVDKECKFIAVVMK